MPAASDNAPRIGAAQLLVQLAFVVALFGALQYAAPSSAAIGGSPFDRAMPLLRMLAGLAIATWFLRSSGQSWADLGLRKPSGWVRPLLLVLIGMPVMIACLKLAVMPLAYRFGVAHPDIGAFTRLRGDWLEYLYWALPVAWGAAAFGEEMLGRGFLLDRFERLFAGLGAAALPIALVAQAAVFGAGHYYQGLGGVIQAGSLGLMFGFVYLLAKRNLWPCIILHGLFDFAAATSLFLGAAPS